MYFNIYATEQIARDIQADRKSEAIREKRWNKARKAVQKLAKSR